MRVLRYRPLPTTLRAVVPDWLDAERLEWVILAVIAGLLVSVYVVLSFVRKVVTKFLLLLVIAALGVSLWIQRADLRACAETVSVHAVRRVRRAAWRTGARSAATSGPRAPVRYAERSWPGRALSEPARTPTSSPGRMCPALLARRIASATISSFVPPFP